MTTNASKRRAKHPQKPHFLCVRFRVTRLTFLSLRSSAVRSDAALWATPPQLVAMRTKYGVLKWKSFPARKSPWVSRRQRCDKDLRERVIRVIGRGTQSQRQWKLCKVAITRGWRSRRYYDGCSRFCKWERRTRKRQLRMEEKRDDEYEVLLDRVKNRSLKLHMKS